LWTTANTTVLQRVARKAKDVGVVGVKKLPSGDMVIQLKAREGKEILSHCNAWLEGVSPSARVIADLYPVLIHGVRIKSLDITD
jgi:hypothetical protein